jgi:hypothetical protein
MSALLVGILVVVVSSVGFWLSMFGRKPIPQSAMAYTAPPAEAVTSPSPGRRGVGTAALAAVGVDRSDRRATPVDIPASVRVRSVALLALGVIAAAALIGVVASLLVVAAVSLLN